MSAKLIQPATGWCFSIYLAWLLHQVERGIAIYRDQCDVQQFERHSPACSQTNPNATAGAAATERRRKRQGQMRRTCGARGREKANVVDCKKKNIVLLY